MGNRPSDEDNSRLLPRRFKNQNIINRLIQREAGLFSHPSCNQYLAARQFYSNVVPNLTCVNIDKPSCFLRKFTPDGKYLIAFSSDQSSLEVFEYQGPQVAASLLSHDHNSEVIGSLDQSDEIRKNLFKVFFKAKHEIQVTLNHEQLNREFSLFTEDSQFVILASSALVSDEAHLHYFDVYRNNESFLSSSRLPMEDVTLYLVDVVTGKACDFRTFKTDRISLSHNQGVYLYKDTLAVLSIQHQAIHLLKVIVNPVTGSAEFQDIRSIGRFCFEDDDYLVSSASAGDPRPIRPFREACMTAMKQRFVTFLFKKANAESDPNAMLNFFSHFGFLSKLKMWKMQLFDERHVLIKYAPEEVVNLRSPDIRSLFVVYDMHEGEILEVYDNNSYRLLQLFELHCDLFRNPCPGNFANMSSSTSNSFFARQTQRRCVQAMSSARNGSPEEARRRILTQLPIAAQSFTCTPYLDHNLFSYDEKWLTALERPKTGNDLPLRFYDRESGLLRFKLATGKTTSSPTFPSTERKLVAFIFHPFDPLAITVQRFNSDYIVNVHMRHSPS